MGQGRQEDIDPALLKKHIRRLLLVLLVAAALTAAGVVLGGVIAPRWLPECSPPRVWPDLIVLAIAGWSTIALNGMLAQVVRVDRPSFRISFVCSLQFTLSAGISAGHAALWGWLGTCAVWGALMLATVILGVFVSKRLAKQQPDAHSPLERSPSHHVHPGAARSCSPARACTCNPVAGTLCTCDSVRCSDGMG